MDLNIHIYKSAGGHRNVWIVMDDNPMSGKRFELGEEDTVGSVIDRYLEEMCGKDKIWS